MTNQNTIWTYWHQGFEEAPWLVKKCAETWNKKHPNWKLNKLDANNYTDFIDPIPVREEVWKKMLLPHRSDLIRTKLLIEYGGVWSDPTCYPIISLDEWLHDYFQEGLFLFTNPGRDRIISNWFIASEPQHPILIDLFNELCEYWNSNTFNNLGTTQKNRVESFLHKAINRNLDRPLIWFSPIMTKLFKHAPYMIYHYKFYQLLKKNKSYMKKWKNMNLLPASVAVTIKRYGLTSELNATSKSWIDNKTTPLFKLDWKIDINAVPKDSILFYLMNK